MKKKKTCLNMSQIKIKLKYYESIWGKKKYKHAIPKERWIMREREKKEGKKWKRVLRVKFNES